MVRQIRIKRDTVHLATHHHDDALGAITVTVTTPPGTEDANVVTWGPAGRYTLALPTGTPRESFSRAIDEWLAAIATGQPHELGARYGRHLVAVLDAAERCLASGCTTTPS